MREELIQLITAYLADVNTVLSIFKSKVGEPPEDKSWEALIPETGHYIDEAISTFQRHGTGISVYYKGRAIDFDFYDRNLRGIEGPRPFITLDPAHLAAYIKSLGVPNERLTDYANLREELHKLAEARIAIKLEYRFYLKADLDKLGQPRPARHLFHFPDFHG